MAPVGFGLEDVDIGAAFAGENRCALIRAEM